MKFTSAVVAALILPGVLAAQTYKVEKWNVGGEGGNDYLTADPATGRVFVSRGTHVMVIDGATGKVLGDIMDTPRVHGIGLAPKSKRGFTTNGGDSTSSMFDLGSLTVQKKIHAGSAGLDGIMYDDATDKILTINHSKPGSAVVIDPKTGDLVGKVTLSDDAPEGGVSNGKDRIFINLEGKNAIDVIDTKSWKVIATWPTCDGPTGIAMDRLTNRIFSACSKESAVLDASTGKIVAKIQNGDGVDALGWDQSQRLLYIPAGRTGDVTIVHEDGPETFTTLATVKTMTTAKTVAVDDVKHIAYVFALERGPSTPPAAAGGRPTPGPITGAWLISIHK